MSCQARCSVCSVVINSWRSGQTGPLTKLFSLQSDTPDSPALLEPHQAMADSGKFLMCNQSINYQLYSRYNEYNILRFENINMTSLWSGSFLTDVLLSPPADDVVPGPVVPSGPDTVLLIVCVVWIACLPVCITQLGAVPPGEGSLLQDIRKSYPGTIAAHHGQQLK